MPAEVPRAAALERAAHRAELRLRFDRALARAFVVVPVWLVAAVVVLVWVKLRVPAPAALARAGYALGAGALGVVAVGVSGFLARRADLAGARALDRHHGLADRVTSALAFARLPAAERTPLMQVAIEDALEAARDLSPRRAAPIHVPRELPLALLLVAGLAVLALVEVRRERVVVVPQQVIDPLVLSEDDLELFREAARELEQKSNDPIVRAAVQRFNQLITDLGERRIDRNEAFRRLADIERELAQEEQSEREARADGLRGVASELSRSDLAKPLARALEQRQLADAEAALRALAERLKKKDDAPSKQQLDELREALRRASQAARENSQRLLGEQGKAEEERRSLLKKKSEGQATPAEQRQLQKKDRELERLDRERKRAERSERQMSQLDRELQKAAEDLARELGESAADLDRGAQEMNRWAQQELSDREKQDLKKRIEELRELLRQEGQGGSERLERLRRFARRAHGQSGSGQPSAGGRRGQGQQGEAQQGEGQQGEGQQGEGQQGEGQQGQPGERQEGEGQGQQGREGEGQGEGQRGRGQRGQGQGEGEGTQGLTLGRGEGGDSPGEGSGAGSEGDQPGGQGQGEGGKSWGDGHDDQVSGAATKPGGKTHSVSAAASDSGKGRSASQSIRGAAQRGFVGRGYRQVYTEYRPVAEEALKQEQIPPGYRFYVQRYFQLIRPRE